MALPTMLSRRCSAPNDCFSTLIPVLPNKLIATHSLVAKLFQVGRDAFINVSVYIQHAVKGHFWLFRNACNLLIHMIVILQSQIKQISWNIDDLTCGGWPRRDVGLPKFSAFLDIFRVVKSSQSSPDLIR